MKALLPMLFCLYLFGCGAGDGTGLDQNGQPIDPDSSNPAPQPPVDPDSSDPAPQPPVDPDALQPTLASIQEKVLTPICTQCHVGSNAPLGLRMDDLETSEANLIDVDSATNPQFKRVEPGNAEQSFLYLKIIGDPSAGNQMPLGQAPLPGETQETIKSWIESGAPISSDQATAGAKRLPAGPQAFRFELRFSQAMDPDAFTASDMEITSQSEASPQQVNINSISFKWTSDKQLEVRVNQLSEQTKSVRILINQPNLSSIVSVDGNWLDGDYDGYAGGVAEYEFTITQ